MNKHELLAAYLDTQFHFVLGGGPFVTVPVSVEQETADFLGYPRVISDSLPALLGNEVAQVWVITAENPKSAGSSTREENDHRNDELRSALERHGLMWHAARGQSPDGQHGEESFFLPSLHTENQTTLEMLVKRLARQFEQNAIFRFIDFEQILVGVLDPYFSGVRPYLIRTASDLGN